MKNKAFELEHLPDISDTISEKTKQIRQEIIDNYIYLKDNSLSVLNCCANNLIIKPLTFFNLFFYIEMFLKTKLILETYLSLEEVENYGHDIYRMMYYLSENNNINFQGFKYLINKIKSKSDERLDFAKYYNFKYNKEIGNSKLIFNTQLTKLDLKTIKEVIEWLDLHI